MTAPRTAAEMARTECAMHRGRSGCSVATSGLCRVRECGIKRCGYFEGFARGLAERQSEYRAAFLEYRRETSETPLFAGVDGG